MASFGELMQKALYLGVGVASYTGSKASSKMAELRTKTQELVDELVKQGEMTTEEARRMVEETLEQAQQSVSVDMANGAESSPKREPRPITIDPEEDEAASSPGDGEAALQDLRQQVASLQEELKRLQQD